MFKVSCSGLNSHARMQFSSLVKYAGLNFENVVVVIDAIFLGEK